MTTPNGLPPKQGLYDPQFEHDACGVGFVCQMKGKRSHDLVQQALTILVNLDHRGAVGAETNTGDGAGILLQVPHNFLKKVTSGLKIELPEPGQYGVAMCYMSPDAKVRAESAKLFEQVVAEEGQKVLGWRDIPVDNSMIGKTAKNSEPFMRQAFIARGANCADDQAFERKLYVIRKRAYHVIRTQGRGRLLVLPESLLPHDDLQGHAHARAGRSYFLDLQRSRTWTRRWRWCTRASPRTPSRVGSARIRIATSPTTARSTPCAATSTG